MADQTHDPTLEARITEAVRRALTEQDPRRRLDALISLPDARGAVARVPAEDLYVAIAEVGLEDATEIVQLATPEQFQTFVDLAGWSKDQLAPHQVLRWLRAARGDEEEDFRHKLKGLDLEVLEVILREFVEVHDLEENPDVHAEGVTMETPEGRYLVEIKAEGVEAFAVRQLLNDLIAEDPFGAVRFLEAVRWELPSELTETAFQFRQARLADLGFPELYEALSLFAFVDPAPLAAPATAPSAGSGLAPAKAQVGYLEACFRDFADAERPAFEEQLRYLINSALVAESAEPGDLDAIRRVSEVARDVLTLGLEHVTGGAPAAAAERVRALGFKRVFQAGFSLTLKLKFRADRLAKQPLFELDEVWLLLPEEERAVRALRRKRPLRALKVEGAEPVPFRSQKELAEAEALLERAERQQAVFAAVLGGDAAKAREAVKRLGIDWSAGAAVPLWLAAVANATLGHTPLAGPVPRARLAELGQALFEGGASGAPRLRDDGLAKAVAALRAVAGEGAGGELERMVAWALGRLLDEVGVPLLREGRLDPAAVDILPFR